MRDNQEGEKGTNRGDVFVEVSSPSVFSISELSVKISQHIFFFPASHSSPWLEGQGCNIPPTATRWQQYILDYVDLALYCRRNVLLHHSSLEKQLLFEVLPRIENKEFSR